MRACARVARALASMVEGQVHQSQCYKQCRDDFAGNGAVHVAISARLAQNMLAMKNYLGSTSCVGAIPWV